MGGAAGARVRLRLSGLRLAGLRLAGLRLSGLRLSGLRVAGLRLSGLQLAAACLVCSSLFGTVLATTFETPPILGDRKVELSWQPDENVAIQDPYFTGNAVLRREAIFDQVHPAASAVTSIVPDSRSEVAYSFALGDSVIRSWGVEDGVVLERTLELGDLPNPANLSLHGSDGRLLGVFPTGQIAVWNVKSGDAPAVVDETGSPVLDGRFFPAVIDTSNLSFATVSADDSVRVWDRPGLLRYSLPIRRNAGSSDGATGVLEVGAGPAPLVAVGTDSGLVRIWVAGSLRPESPTRILGTHPGAVTTLAFSPDQSILASGDVTGQMRVWRVADGALLGTYETAQASPRLEFNQPFGRILFVGLGDGTLELRDGTDGRLLRRENLVNATVTEMTATRNGTSVLIGDDDGRIIVLRAGICRPSPEEPRCFGGYKVWRGRVPNENDPSLKLLRVFTYNDPSFGDSTWTFVGPVRKFADPDSIILRTAPNDPEIPDDQEEELAPAGPHNGIPYFYSVTRFDLVYLAGVVFEVLVNSVQDGFYRDPGASAPTPIIPHAGARGDVPELGEVVVVPNPYEIGKVPWELSGEPHVEFRNLPENAEIRVFTVSGDFVREINHQRGKYGETRNSAEWNLRNEAGRLVTSGVYIFVVTTPARNGRPGEVIQGYFSVVM